MKQRSLKYIVPFLTALAVGVFLYKALLNTGFVNKDVKLDIELDAYQASEMQFFLEDDERFETRNMRSLKINAAKDLHISFDFPFVYQPGKLRLDPGFSSGKWLLKKITLRGVTRNVTFDQEGIYKNFKPGNDIKTFRLEEEGVYIESNGPDPNILSAFGLLKYANSLTEKPLVYKLPFAFCFCMGIFVFYIVRKRLSDYLDEEIRTVHVFVLIFLVMTTLPLLWMNLYTNSTPSGENRKPHEKPVFYFDKILDYPAQYNAYFDDNFGFRKALSTFNSYYKFKFFGVSSKPNVVVVGKDSWLYSVDPDVVGDYQNTSLYSEEQLKTIQHHLEEAYEWHASRGIQFYVMMLPIKSNIYPEFLPDRVKRKNEMSKLLQLRDFMAAQNSPVKIIDITTELLNAKSSMDVYYQHDIHMNFQGGFIAYTKLMEEINKKNPNLKPTPQYKYVKTLKHVHNADLSRILSLEDILLNDEWHPSKIKKLNFKGAEPALYETAPTLQPTIHTLIKNSKAPRVVVYRDSFFNLMIPFFSDHFSDCVYLWTNELSVEVTDKEKPNIVVYEMLESNIDKLLEDNPTGIRK